MIRHKTNSYSEGSPSRTYERTEIGGLIVRNSRSDHVEKLMKSLKKRPGKLSQGKSDSLTSPPINKHKTRLQLFIRLTVTIKDSLSPKSYYWHKLLGKGSFGEVYLA